MQFTRFQKFFLIDAHPSFRNNSISEVELHKRQSHPVLPHLITNPKVSKPNNVIDTPKQRVFKTQVINKWSSSISHSNSTKSLVAKAPTNQLQNGADINQYLSLLKVQRSQNIQRQAFQEQISHLRGLVRLRMKNHVQEKYIRGGPRNNNNSDYALFEEALKRSLEKDEVIDGREAHSRPSPSPRQSPSERSSGAVANDSSQRKSPRSPRYKQSILVDNWNQWYQDKYRDQIKSLRKQLQNLLDRVQGLHKIWRNEERVQSFLAKILPNALRKHFKNQKGPGFLIQNVQQLMRSVQLKEMVYDHDQNIAVHKYNFSIQHDIEKVIELIDTVLHTNEKQQIQTVKEEIQKELKEVQSLEQKFQSDSSPSRIKFIQFKDTYLSYQNPRAHDTVRDQHLKKVERQFGAFKSPSHHVREINEQLNNVMVQLYRQ